MSNGSADLVEVFSSIQGEGLLVGLRQIFIRFSGCNLTCQYCDTPSAPVDLCQIESTPGRRDFIQLANPVPTERLISLIGGWHRGWPGIHHSISITGGEPLLCHKQLQELLPALRHHLPIYLETNGILHHELAAVIDLVDFVSMDVKLPSTSGYTDVWAAHERFLAIAARKKTCVKAVVGTGTEDWEIHKTAELVAAVDRSIPLILQPYTNQEGRVDLPAIRMLEMQETASRYLQEVRVIPQTHKFIGQL
ncbi:7-carboxy-7-deazaguanine synthase QueE [Geotalea sp. SG265]|uniref:7-carboxy-7-deazaguanine synthase QueE n=1 Tax=Geotalea sp. SG265 TaxID=2922867 RepID=UPI001FB0416B|nr:7-carboxy-7-deazaguanine synthase QueE [Geotalea sp. SG265]